MHNHPATVYLNIYIYIYVSYWAENGLRQFQINLNSLIRAGDIQLIFFTKYEERKNHMVSCIYCFIQTVT